MADEYTTEYTSDFPSGLMDPNIQAERRSDSSKTVAAARDYNRHDVEILRIQEVIGTIPTGVVSPSGSIYNNVVQNITDINNILSGSGVAASEVPFSNDEGDNYDFVKWFLEWYGNWSDLSAGGTPTTLEIIKSTMANKYDVEVLLNPVFMYPAERHNTALGGDNQYFLYTGQGETINCGRLNNIPKKPVGGGWNLNHRPWPIYDVYCETCGGFVEGITTLTSGHVLRFYTYDTGALPAADAGVIDGQHVLGMFSNTPFTFATQPSGAALDIPVTSSYPPAPSPSGAIVPVPPPWPPWGAPPPPPPAPTGSPDPVPPSGAIIEVPDIIFGSAFDVYTKGGDQGGIAVSPQNRFSAKPVPYNGDAIGIVQIPGSWQYTVDLGTAAAQVVVPLFPGWNMIYAVVTIGNTVGPVSSSNWFCYVDLMSAGDFGAQTWPPPEIQFDIPTVTLNQNEYKTVPIGYTYAAPGDVGSAMITLADEDPVSPSNIWCVSIGVRAVPQAAIDLL